MINLPASSADGYPSTSQGLTFTYDSQRGVWFPVRIMAAVDFYEQRAMLSEALALTTDVSANVVKISLPPGEWDVFGMVNFNAVAATVTLLSAGTHITSATLPTDGSEQYSGVALTTATIKLSIPLIRKRIKLTTYADIYLIAKATFSAGTVSAYGVLNARLVPPYEL